MLVVSTFTQERSHYKRNDNTGGSNQRSPLGTNNPGRGKGHGQSCNQNRQKRGANDGRGYKSSIKDIETHVCDVSRDQSGADLFATVTRVIGLYISRELTDGGNYVNAFDPDDLGFDPIPQPSSPNANANEVDMDMWKLDFKEWHGKTKHQSGSSKCAHAIVLEQCSEAIRDRIEGSNECAEIARTSHGGRGRGGPSTPDQLDHTHLNCDEASTTGAGNSTGDINGTRANSDNYLNAVHLNYSLASIDEMVSKQAELPSTWILADSCSTVNIISNKELLHDIFKASVPMVVNCNAGSVELTKQGYLGNYAHPVWYRPNGVANIISLYKASRSYRITWDTNIDNIISIHKANGSTISFLPSIKGLY